MFDFSFDVKRKFDLSEYVLSRRVRGGVVGFLFFRKVFYVRKFLFILSLN